MQKAITPLEKYNEVDVILKIKKLVPLEFESVIA